LTNIYKVLIIIYGGVFTAGGKRATDKCFVDNEMFRSAFLSTSSSQATDRQTDGRTRASHAARCRLFVRTCISNRQKCRLVLFINKRISSPILYKWNFCYELI